MYVFIFIHVYIKHIYLCCLLMFCVHKTNIYIYINAYVHIKYEYGYIYIYLKSNINKYIYIYIYTYIYMYIYIYIYIYINWRQRETSDRRRHARERRRQEGVQTQHAAECRGTVNPHILRLRIADSQFLGNSLMDLGALPPRMQEPARVEASELQISRPASQPRAARRAP